MTEFCRKCPFFHDDDDNRVSPTAQCNCRTGFDDPTFAPDCHDKEYRYALRVADDCGLLRFVSGMFGFHDFDAAISCAMRYYKAGNEKVLVDRYEKADYEWRYVKTVLTLEAN